MHFVSLFPGENGHLYELNLAWNNFRTKGAVEVATGVRVSCATTVFPLNTGKTGKRMKSNPRNYCLEMYYQPPKLLKWVNKKVGTVSKV